MASRESQGLQVALILFVMITVVLAVTTYLYFRKAEEKIRQATAAEAKAKQSEQAAMSLQFQIQLLKHMMGYDRKTEAELDSIKAGLGADTTMEQIVANYDRDIAMYGAGFAGQELSYRTLPEHLISTINARNKSLADANTIQGDLERDRDQKLQAEEARANDAEQKLLATRTELEQERKNFNTERARMTQENSQVAAILPARQKEFEQTTDGMQTKIAELSGLNRNLRALNEQLVEEKKSRETPRYVDPAGEVIWVNTEAGTVWINLGLSDGLKRQQTFSVFDEYASGMTEENIKARIEVTKVEQDRAEARVLEDKLEDPILQNDKIYSPTFKRGRKSRFALAGLLDIDGDGKPDQDKVRSLIALNGGVVDAELLEDGSIAGEMTAETRYIVKGERPDERTNKALLDGFTRMTGRATELGVESISVDRLMDLMGYHAKNPVEQLNRGGTGGQREQETFRKRSPRSSVYP